MSLLIDVGPYGQWVAEGVTLVRLCADSHRTLAITGGVVQSCSQSPINRGAIMAHNIVGLWDIIQDNGFTVPVNIDSFKPQDGSFTLHAEQGGGSNVTGTGDGRVENDLVHFVITWNNQTQGAYNGAFDARGIIHGATFDVKHPESAAKWHSSRSF